MRAPLGAARADLSAPGMSAGSPSRAVTTVRCAPLGDVSTDMIGLYPGGISGTPQQSNFPRARVRRVVEPPRLPRGSRGPGYEVARDVSWGNPRLRALRKYLLKYTRPLVYFIREG